jgi:hypothetical protein
MVRIHPDPPANFVGGVAQLGERLLCKQEVIGSIPFTSTSAWSSNDNVFSRMRALWFGFQAKTAVSIFKNPEEAKRIGPI